MKKNSNTPKDAAAASCPDKAQYKHQPTKLELVLAYLIKHGSMTPGDAMTHCGCWRLAAVIHTLKKAGISISTQQEPHEGGFHARYYLNDSGAAERHQQRLAERSNKGRRAAA